jgi:hypothetical protein
MGPDFAPDVWMISSSAAAVSGTGYSGAPKRAGGGFVKAIVRTATNGFRRNDTFNYCDPNVPPGQSRVVKWSFGDFNPALSAPAGDSSTKHSIFGWAATKVSSC